MAIEDAYLRHQINLEQYATGRVNKMMRTLRVMEDNILTTLRKRKVSTFQKERLTAIMRSVRGDLASGYLRIGDTMRTDLERLSKIEADFNASSLTTATPEASINSIDANRLFTATQTRPFQGKTMNVWLRSLEYSQARLITNEVRQGWLLGETNDQIAARLTGNDVGAGIFKHGRNNVSTIVRSSVNQLSAQARDRTFKANHDVIEAVEWIATLDGRTTVDICAPRDGMLYTVNQEPIDHGLPWDGGPGAIHWQCRSVSAPKIRGQKDIERAGLDFNKETTSHAKSTVRFDKDTKTVVGKGVRNPDAVRRGAGQMYAPKTTYGEWFASQPAWFQKNVLGTKRYGDYRSGKFKIGKFDTKAIKPISSKTLKKVSGSGGGKSGGGSAPITSTLPLTIDPRIAFGSGKFKGFDSILATRGATGKSNISVGLKKIE